jgi:hypothetical protein
MIYKNGINLQPKLVEYINTSNSIYIFSAYIKLDSLKVLLDNNANVKAVFVRWEPKDLILGSSDLEVYLFLKQKNVALFRNPRLHLKAYLDEYKRCFLTSANISSRALNFPEFEKYNYEIGTVVDNLNIDDRLYFNMIESESLLITDNVYNQISQQLLNIKSEFLNEIEFDFLLDSSDNNFLISSLPMSVSVEKLCEIYENKELATDIELNCMLHDLVLYKIPLGLSKTILLEKLKTAFLNHPFIIAFLENLSLTKEIYFGKAKEWIHNNCSNVPLPRKWEITENIQILYKWFVELGDGMFIVDVPGAYSERLSIINH